MRCDALPGGFNGLIFDCDGTLAETLAAHVQALQDALRQCVPSVSAHAAVLRPSL